MNIWGNLRRKWFIYVFKMKSENVKCQFIFCFQKHWQTNRLPHAAPPSLFRSYLTSGLTCSDSASIQTSSSPVKGKPNAAAAAICSHKQLFPVWRIWNNRSAGSEEPPALPRVYRAEPTNPIRQLAAEVHEIIQELVQCRWSTATSEGLNSHFSFNSAFNAVLRPD